MYCVYLTLYFGSLLYKMPFVYINARDGKRYKTSEEGAKMRFAK